MGAEPVRPQVQVRVAVSAPAQGTLSDQTRQPVWLEQLEPPEQLEQLEPPEQLEQLEPLEQLGQLEQLVGSAKGCSTRGRRRSQVV